MIIHLICPGQPVSAKNHQTPIRTSSGRLRIIKGKAITSWYERVVPVLETQWAAYQMPTLTAPVHITMHQYLVHPLTSDANPDGDNVQSGVWDALQKAGVIANDRQVVAWAGTKTHDRINPRVCVEIRALTRNAA